MALVVFKEPVLKSYRLVCTWILVALLGVCSFPSEGMCRKAKVVHVVKPGDSVAKIADYYGVSQRDLRELNDLRKGKSLRIGQELKIPNVLRVSGKKYVVREGDSLGKIAQKFRRTVKEIAVANKINTDTPLKAGRTLVIPDKSSSAKTLKVEGESPQPILFLRVRTGEREKLQLYSRKGTIIHKSVKRLSYLARDKKGKQQVKRLHFRLIKMLQQVSQQFPGKPIEIISGYRANSTGAESQHAFGRAMDIRIPGVSGKQVFRFCKSLPRAGCGYYPNSGFVHIDAREKKVSWIDHSN